MVYVVKDSNYKQMMKFKSLVGTAVQNFSVNRFRHPRWEVRRESDERMIVIGTKEQLIAI